MCSERPSPRSTFALRGPDYGYFTHDILLLRFCSCRTVPCDGINFTRMQLGQSDLPLAGSGIGGNGPVGMPPTPAVMVQVTASGPTTAPDGLHDHGPVVA